MLIGSADAGSTGGSANSHQPFRLAGAASAEIAPLAVLFQHIDNERENQIGGMRVVAPKRQQVVRGFLCLNASSRCRPCHHAKRKHDNEGAGYPILQAAAFAVVVVTAAVVLALAFQPDQDTDSGEGDKIEPERVVE